MIILISGARALLEVISVRAINWISLYTIVRSMGFGGDLFQWRSAETVYRHLHHPAKNN